MQSLPCYIPMERVRGLEKIRVDKETACRSTSQKVSKITCTVGIDSSRHAST